MHAPSLLDLARGVPQQRMPMAREPSRVFTRLGVKRRSTGVALEWLRFLVTLGVLAILVRSLVVAPFNIPSRSMTPRMLVGDYLFVAKWPYGYSRHSFPFSPGLFEGRIGAGRPQRGDIVVFKSPADGSDYVKRVIGLPGDRVRLTAGELVINGRPVPRIRVADYLEPAGPDGACGGEAWPAVTIETAADGARRCRTPRWRETLANGASYDILDIGETVGDTTPEFAVPPGHYFMMGDDRDRSADSRFAASPGGGVGMVPEENLVGRALVVFWSTDGSSSWGDPTSWFDATRWDRIGESF